MTQFIISLLIILALWIIRFFLRKQQKTDNLLSRRFECGYTPYFFSRFSFSTHYFIIALIFLFLDLELSIIIPFFIIRLNSWKKINILFLFVNLIIVRLIIEWKEGKIEWTY